MSSASGSFVARMWGAARLDACTYEEVEADTSATLQAGLVVLLSSIAAGLGSLDNTGLGGIVGFIVASFVGWVLWAAVTLWIGTRWLPGPETESDMGELLRTLGFSSAPGLIRVLGLVPVLAGPVFLIGAVWMLVAMVVAVRQALDYEGTGRAILVCAIGFPVYLGILVVSHLLLGPWPI